MHFAHGLYGKLTYRLVLKWHYKLHLLCTSCVLTVNFLCNLSLDTDKLQYVDLVTLTFDLFVLQCLQFMALHVFYVLGLKV